MGLSGDILGQMSDFSKPYHLNSCPKILTFWLFLYLCVYINLPRFQKHVDNFQVSQLGRVMKASISILLLKNKDIKTEIHLNQTPESSHLCFYFRH